MARGLGLGIIDSIPFSASGRAVSDADRGLMRAARRSRNAAEPSGRPIVSAAREPPQSIVRERPHGLLSPGLVPGVARNDG